MKRSKRKYEHALYFGLGLIASGLIYPVAKPWLNQWKHQEPSLISTPGKRTAQATLPALAAPARLRLDPDTLIQVRSLLQPDWEMNPKAPSWLALFEKAPGQIEYSHILEVPAQTLLQKEFTLAKLKAGSLYLLQGSLYQCKKVDHGVCSLRSYSYELEVATQATGALDHQIIELK